MIDPRTGQPVRSAVLAAVSLHTAADADAWSTALLVQGRSGVALLEQAHPRAKALVVGEDGGRRTIGFRDERSDEK